MTAPIVVLDDLRERIGAEIAVSDWLTVSQERIRQFAGATGDEQWIHVDQERAGRESPYGTTVAHGFLTLSLIGHLLRETLSIRGVRLAVNYGLERVRFTAPVPAGSRIRGRFTIASAEERNDDSVKVVWNVTLEREEDGKPCCLAQWIVLYYRDSDGREQQAAEKVK